MSRLVFAFAALLVFSACAPSAQPGAPWVPTPNEVTPKRMTFMAGYKPQANLPFVGAYVAQERGYFAEEKLTVEIRHALQGEHTKLLATNQIDVSTANADSVLKNVADPGIPMVAIALIGQRSDQVYAVLNSSGIKTPKDFEGKTVGYKLRPAPDYLAILQKFNVDRSKIKEVSVGYDPRVLMSAQVDVYPVFRSNEPDTLRRLGADTTLFDAADYGVPTLGLTYITTQDKVAKDPDMLARFIRATLKGIEFAAKNPEGAIDIVMKYAPEEDRDHQRYMLGVELDNAVSTQGYGSMTADQWKGLYDGLMAYGGLAKPIDPTTAYTDAILRLARSK